MKLKVMMKEFSVGKSLCLCDEHGKPLPNQTAVELRTAVGGAGRLTVEFVVDGGAIELVKSV